MKKIVTIEEFSRISGEYVAFRYDTCHQTDSKETDPVEFSLMFDTVNVRYFYPAYVELRGGSNTMTLSTIKRLYRDGDTFTFHLAAPERGIDVTWKTVLTGVAKSRPQ